MIVRDSNGSYEFIDFREKAPAAAFTDMFDNKTALSLYGGLASGVPGELRGLEYLHKHYGKLPWAHVMQPAIYVARNGFTVTQDLVNYEKAAIGKGPNFLAKNPDFAIDFAPNGTLLGLNETITRRRYADTLETISKQGPDAFYTGPIANATIQALKAANGTMTLDDLKNYTVAIRKPAQITYRNYKLTACSAPSSGTVALSVMKTIEGYSDIGEAATLNLSTHRLDEAMRFAYGEVSISAFWYIFHQKREDWQGTDSEHTWVIHYSFQASMSISKKCSTRPPLRVWEVRFQTFIPWTSRLMTLLGYNPSKRKYRAPLSLLSSDLIHDLQTRNLPRRHGRRLRYGHLPHHDR